MTLRKLTMCALVAAGLAGSATMTVAQDAAEAPALVAATIDCRYQLRPMETAICSTPVLAAMDIQMQTLFNALNSLVNKELGLVMAADQQSFMKEREVCSSDGNCIGQVYAARIGELDKILKDLASRGPY